jgi:hypothetical protein
MYILNLKMPQNIITKITSQLHKTFFLNLQQELENNYNIYIISIHFIINDGK